MMQKVVFAFCLIFSFTEITRSSKVDRKIWESTNLFRTENDYYSRNIVTLNFVELIEQYHGYTAEEYKVQTKDGYILKLHRISGSPNSPKVPGKPVVYVQHGLLGSSDFHVVLGPSQALPFLLADAGYDVWLGNVRGNVYSKGHISLSSDRTDINFWDFSVDEASLIDLPLFIDTVLNKTNQQKLTYIGYSMGTTMSYMLLSSQPEYNDKMNVVISLAPVAYFVPPVNTVLTELLLIAQPTTDVANAIMDYEILPQSKLIQIIGEDICTTVIGMYFCESILSVVCTVDNLNYTALPTLLTYNPAGTSLNTLNHFRQILNTRKLSKFDFGFIKNQQKYGTLLPPDYDLTKITAPQALYYGDKDVFIDVKAAEKLNNTLKNVVVFEKAPKGYNHLDFIWAMDVRNVFYGQILDTVRKFS